MRFEVTNQHICNEKCERYNKCDMLVMISFWYEIMYVYNDMHIKVNAC